MKQLYVTFLFLFLTFIASSQTSPTGSSTEVGITEGQLSVSLTGAANYNIPIAVPAGINGVVPQISLAYNSQGGIGLAGFGWNIMGISAITRVPSTMFHDGTIDPVDFNALDRFALDDKRLILKSSESFDVAATKKVYETEIYSNLKISYYSGQIQDNRYLDIVFIPIDYFIVEYPDGSSAKYENHGSATDWTISYWENPQGVSIIYEYSQYSGSTSSTNNAVIEKIKYGSLKSSTAQINEVQFVYKPRYRAEQAYVGGKSFVRDKMLSEIIVKGNGLGFRSYSLSHDSSSLSIERLKSITEKSGDGAKSYNPTVFEYKNNQGLFHPQIETAAESNVFSMSPTSNIVINGDFDGDGDIEFFQQNSAGKLSLNKILDDNSVVSLAEINFPATDKMFAINSLDANLKISAKQNLCTYTTNFYKIYSYNANTKSLDFEYQKPVPSGHSPYRSGDFNGDGVTDFVSLKEAVNGYCEISLVDLDRNKTTDYITPAGSIEIGTTRLGDINGDGKTDLVVFRGDPYNYITVYTLKNNVFTQLFRWTQNMPGDIGSLKWSRIEVCPIVMGDFNGDGKCDIFLSDLKKILISTGGNSFMEEPLLAYKPRNYDHTYVPEVLVAYDYNNDGKEDILSIKTTPTGYSNPKSNFSIDLFYRTGVGITWFNYSFNTQISEPFNYKFIPLFTRKNKMDPSKTDLAVINDYDVSFFSSNNFLEDQNLIKSITLGNGVKEYITYAQLNDNNGIYTSGNSQVYPNLDLKFNSAFKIVSQLEKQSATQYKKQLFRYRGAVMNLEGLGFLGFGSTVQTNWHNDSSPIISYIARNDISLRGANVENYSVLGLYEPLEEVLNPIPGTIVKRDTYNITGIENLVATESVILKPNTWIQSGSSFSAKIDKGAVNTAGNAPSTFITKSLLTYESELFSNKVFKIKNISNKQFNGLENTSIENKTDYDNYNNPTKITIDVKENGITRQTSTMDFVYENLTAPAYIIGRPLSKIQNVTLGSEKMRTEEVFIYNPNQLLSQIKKKGDATTNYITEDRLYDGFGNITKRTLKAGQDSRELSYEYDTSGRFLFKNTDAEKLVTTYIYNTNGTLKSQTNPFGQTTGYEYDSWFKTTKETDYLGKTRSYSYNRNNEQTIIASVSDDGTAGAKMFDDLGRKIRDGVVNVDGSVSSVDYLYDIQDRNYKVSEPYFGASGMQWNETKYDDYGRVIQNISFSGKVTNIDRPPGLKTTITDGTKTETYIKDAMGNIISMSDSPSNVIKYSYYPNSGLKETDYGGIKTTILQDGWGRKKELKDPSSGIFKYSYNDFGDLIKEENVNGIINYNLSSLGKLDTKTISGNGNTNSKTTNTYDSTTKLLIKSKYDDLINGTNSITTDYKYDASKRISVKTETTPYAVFIKRYKYDAFGRLEYENSTAKIIGTTKISSRTIKNTYKNGAHYQVLDSITNNVLWQTDLVNSRGNLLSAKTGPLTITNIYDSNGFASVFKYDKTTPSSNILTLNTVFDVTKSNFISRANNLFGWNETFDYDEKDRLTKFNNILGVQEIQAYDDKGRITQNSLGSYKYNISDKPYQNSSVTLSPEATGYYANREGVFNDAMEEKTGWGTEKYPNTNFFSYDGIKVPHATGKNTLKLANTTSTEQYVFADKWISIDNQVPTEYTYSAWVYSDNPQAQIFLYMKDAANTITTDNVVSNNKGTWIPVTKTFLVPATVKKIRLRLDNNALGNVWFDDVQIRKTSNPIVTDRLLNISYNSFKSPVQIEETGIDKVSFAYNDNNQRSTMFHGSLDDMLLRPLRKHYSADGTMEIKENRTTGLFEFVTYLAGDGYSAPIVFKSDGLNTGNFLYLQRDYQGSIVSITDTNGAVIEKRLFDAWGGIIKVQDGAGNILNGLTVLDRGYTGHEHIQSVGVINMNGRLYDPKVRRFLQPDNNIQDPYNTQNYNRYGYVLNNPLKYTDPSGESIFEFALGFLFSTYVHGGAASGGQANPFKWGSNTWTSAFAGAASSAGSFVASSYVTGVANNYLDNYSNKPPLGASAVGPRYDLNPFVGDSGLEEPVNANDLNLENWYTFGGRANWAFGAAATIGLVKGSLNSEQMYAEGIRRGIFVNYQLTGRNLSMFREAPMTKTTKPISKVGQWAGMLGKASFFGGVIMDGIAVRNYMNDPNSPNAVHPYKAGLNTIMGAIGTWGSPLAAIPSLLYFGIDGFYHDGWVGLGRDQESLYRENKAINPSYQAFPGALKI